MEFKVYFYSTKPYDVTSFEKARGAFEGKYGVKLRFTFDTERLTEATAEKARGHDAVCIFVNDNCNAAVTTTLAHCGIKLILLRCAGFNNVDAKTAAAHHIPILRVPRYSPNAVAEHAATLVFALVRRLNLSIARTQAHNFSLSGLEGFDLAKRTIGVVGTGAIGKISAGILAGTGAKVVAFDPRPDKAWAKKLGVEYVTIEKLFSISDVITLHIPLTPQNKHIINAKSIAQMKDNVTIVNTSRGGLVDTQAMIDGLVSGKVRGYGLDVYENEAPYFFDDHSLEPMADPVLARLIALPNVIMTGHQAFFTDDALFAISSTTLGNIGLFLDNVAYGHFNEVTGCPKQQNNLARFSFEKALRPKL